MTGPNMHILLIDDDKYTGDLITAVATNIGYSCTATTAIDDFIALINSSITLIMLDLMMPNIDGIELLRMLAKKSCKINIILMSGADLRVLENAQNLANSLGLNVIAILQKPFGISDLENILISNNNKAITKEALVYAKPELIEFTKLEFQTAFDREEFILYYQPQVEIITNRFIGVEALIRWQHPSHGLLQPDQFISHMETLGLIDQLAWYSVNNGLQQIKLFVDNEGFMPTLSLNISPYSLHDLQFPDRLIIAANENAVDPDRITIEITESGLINELSNALDILTRLRMKQFNLSIDDFGTGFAMIDQLRQIPATELKLDKKLVQSLQTQDTSAQVIIIKIIEMGHDLKMKIVAEGVETADQLEFLRANNCDIAQGYFFSKPLTSPELQNWITHHKNTHG
jgi:EAL domain-containing protein (putative c-di-GMP-specific phosphodiesterase class I)/ActR/RegA family two-component response regulator